MARRFFILGAPKCGTTTLAHWLDQTETVFMCDPKEPHFHASDYHQTWTEFDPRKGDYEALFSGVTDNHVAAVDGSTNQLWSRDAVSNILRDYPDAGFIVCLRKPGDMARSLHQHSLFWGLETIEDFEKAWKAQDGRLAGKNPVPWHPNPLHLQYRDVCAIGSQVERLLSQVEAKNVLFVFLEDLAGTPKETYERVVGFLGATPSQITYESRNVTRDRKSVALNTVIRHLKHRVKNKPLRKIIDLAADPLSAWNQRPSRKTPVDPAFQDHLRAYFESEVEKLSMATGRNLDHWRA